MTLILQRYLFRELVKVFLLSLVAVTAVMLVLLVGQLVSRQALSGKYVLWAVPLLLPPVLVYTVPATVLFAATLVYGRFARDNEFDAVRMSGIHPLLVLVPAVALATVLSGGVLYLAAEWVPRCYYRVRNIGLNVEVAADAFFRALDRERTWSDGVFTIFVTAREGNTAKGVVIEKRNADTREPELLVRAESATFRFDAANDAVKVQARQAWVETFGGAAPTRARLQDTHEQTFPLPKAPKPKPRDLPLGEVLRRLRSEEPGMEPQRVQGGLPDETPAEEQAEGQARARRRLLSEVHLRLNLALSALSFVLVGVPVAIWFRRGHILAAFLVALGPMLLFHVATFVTKNVSQGGSWPVASPWLANALLWILGGSLLWRLFRR